MARGWESKAVESQIEDRQGMVAKSGEKKSADEQERARKRHGLELSRTRIRNELAATRSDTHRATLEKALAFLNDELDRLGSESTDSHS